MKHTIIGPKCQLWQLFTLESFHFNYKTYWYPDASNLVTTQRTHYLTMQKDTLYTTISSTDTLGIENLNTTYTNQPTKLIRYAMSSIKPSTLLVYDILKVLSQNWPLTRVTFELLVRGTYIKVSSGDQWTILPFCGENILWASERPTPDLSGSL